MEFCSHPIRRGLGALVILAAVAAAGQQSNTPSSPPPGPQPQSRPARPFTTDYTKPVSPFPNVFKPYQARTAVQPQLSNSPRIDQLIRDGKLMLSMDDAIALALENNLDLAIARYNLPIADTDILRTSAGAQARGVSTGLVSGTPGGGGGGVTGATGSGAGGTSTAAGGAGAGSGGIVTSTSGAGPSAPSYDPFFTVGADIEHATSPQSNIVFSGVPVIKQNSGVLNFGYNQGFATGTSINVTWNNNRQTSNSTRTTLVPQLNSNTRLTITQPLLQGFGITLNRRFMITAKNNREIADVAFRQQVQSTVSQIEDIYWDLVNAYEDMQVKQQTVTLAQKLLSDTQKQVQIGTQAPIEAVSAQSNLATANQNLIVSQTNLAYQQLLMKNAITRNMSDPVLASAQVIPTDTMQLPAQEPVQPVEDLINEALSNRPELAESRIDLSNRDLTKKGARNALLPQVNLLGWFGTSALAGNFNPANVCNASGQPFGCTPAASVPSPTGFTDVMGNIFGYNAPDYAVGFNVTIPIRNRAAQADQVRSELEYRQAQMRLEQLQNQIRIEVRNAQFAVQQNRARVDAAQAAADFAQQSLDAEQKKYALGASTNYNVMQAQNNLAMAESNLVAARTAYVKQRVELERVTSRTLSDLGIDIGDAETGSVSKMPTVPGVTPRPANQQLTQPQTPPAAPQTHGPEPQQ
ncbi:MAG TPA: TolC family protein [Terriglobales bacterium]|nr:TolC family protein [Terriglobales bacterium]